jgi:type VI secretion system protein ImpH
LASPSRHADGLKDIIGHHFGLPSEIEEFAGEWLAVPEELRWRLGRDPENGRLGRAALGARVWSRTDRFRVVLGPLTELDFEHMLPGSPAVDALSSLVRLYTNDEWGWELRLVLAPSVGASMRLGGRARLGWTTRIGSAPPVEVDLAVDPVAGTTRRISKPPRRSLALSR